MVGGRWLPNLLTWGGILLMLVGGILAYPTIQFYLAAPDAQMLEFSVTLAPATVTPESQLAATAAPSTSSTSSTSSAASAAPTSPPALLPETELEPTQEPTSDPRIIPVLPTPTALSETAAPDPTATRPRRPTPTVDPSSIVPNRLVIPAIDLDTSVIEVGWETQEVDGQVVSDWIVPDSFAAGWHRTSAPPGQVGNTVLNGHHNINGEVFRDLVNLEPGDQIALYTPQDVYYYSVVERHILPEKGQSMEVRLENAQWIQPSEDERLTLVTCWPYTNNTHRLVIVAQPVPSEPTLNELEELKQID